MLLAAWGRPLSTNLDWLFVLSLSFLQSFLSAGCALAFGIWGAFGLMSLPRSPWSAVFRTLSLLPGFLPPLVVTTSAMQIWALFHSELRGFWAIVILHALVNTGLVAIAVERLIQSKMSRLTDLCAIEGVGRLRYLKDVLLPYLRPDLSVLFVMLFGFAMTSFSIPFLVGGSQYSLEVLIFDKMKVSHDWGQALLMSLTQVALVLVLIRGVSRNSWTDQVAALEKKFYGSFSGLFVLGFVMMICMGGLFWGVSDGVADWRTHADYFSIEFYSALIGSLRLVIAVSLFSFFGLLTISFLTPSPLLHSFLVGYLSPSPVIVAFALWTFGPNGGVWSEIKMALALTLLALPSLYRWKLASQLSGLRSQIQVAQLLGASSISIFRRVVFPQVAAVVFWLTGAACFWAAGDFAVTTILGFGHTTLGTLAEGLVGSYRLELAAVISLLMVGFGFLFFISWGALGRVVGHKLNS